MRLLRAGVDKEVNRHITDRANCLILNFDCLLAREYIYNIIEITQYSFLIDMKYYGLAIWVNITAYSFLAKIMCGENVLFSDSLRIYLYEKRWSASLCQGIIMNSPDAY